MRNTDEELVALLHLESSFTFSELTWDTNYFGVTCAKVVLHKFLEVNEWIEVKKQISKYQFVSIINENSEPGNAQLVGKETSAFLADINVQFTKKINRINEKPKTISIHQGLERNNFIVDLAEFKYSKFIEDPELVIRGGGEVYKKWIENSFNDRNKYYALSKDESGEVNGFILYSYLDNACVVELIAVSSKATKSGIGRTLFNAVEYEAHMSHCSVIKVGTQVRNTAAINFYHKLGCTQIGCHQVYHLWN